MWYYNNALGRHKKKKFIAQQKSLSCIPNCCKLVILIVEIFVLILACALNPGNDYFFKIFDLTGTMDQH